MDDLFSLDYAEDVSANTQILLNITAADERTFLSAIGGKAARKEDIAAMVDQYIATHIGTLCFAGSDKAALQIWAERCRAVGLCCLQTVSINDVNSEVFANPAADGFVLDCRDTVDLAKAAEVLMNKTTESGLLYILVNDAPNSLPNLNWTAADGVIVCDKSGQCTGDLPTADWLACAANVFAGFGNFLCEANGKKWAPTGELMNGFAVRYLSQGCAGIWLDGFCANLFNPDSVLYDIYETCGRLYECIGTKRRHLHLKKSVELAAHESFACQTAVGPKLDGAPVCLVLAVGGTQSKDAIDVLADGNAVEFTGNPAVYARSERGVNCANQCVETDGGIFEFYIPKHNKNDVLSLVIRNKTDRMLHISWLEITVNI